MNDVSDEPRDERGRWTSEGGGGGSEVTIHNFVTDAQRSRWRDELDAASERASDSVEGKYSQNDALAHMSAALRYDSTAKLSQRANMRAVYATDKNGRLVGAGLITWNAARTTATVEHVGAISHGAGAQVAKELISEAKSRGVRRIKLETEVPKYWSRFGFVDHGDGNMSLNLGDENFVKKNVKLW